MWLRSGSAIRGRVRGGSTEIQLVFQDSAHPQTPAAPPRVRIVAGFSRFEAQQVADGERNRV